MLNPGNVDIAIKDTVWISQGVPCPVSMVTCYTEQLGGGRQAVAMRRRDRWGVVSTVFLVPWPLRGHYEVVMIQSCDTSELLRASDDCKETAPKPREGFRHRREAFSSQASVQG